MSRPSGKPDVPQRRHQMLYSADEPDRLRGPQHHYGWADELAAWRRLQYAWDMLQMGMRLGDHPQVCVTTTPRPLPLIKQLVKDELCYTVRGITYDNLDNLAPTFRRAVVAKYEGTTLGRQELDAEILDDMPGALLSRVPLDDNRVDAAPEAVLRRSSAWTRPARAPGDETGLVRRTARRRRAPVPPPRWSEKLTPHSRPRGAGGLYKETDADVLVVEDNCGKDWVATVFMRRMEGDARQRGPPPLRPRATRPMGKQLRAQPVAMRYEQDLVHHVGSLPELEDQYTTWIPEEDPDQVPRPHRRHGPPATYLHQALRAAARQPLPHGARRAERAPAVHTTGRMETMTIMLLVLGALATARVTRLITTDRITEAPRNWVLRRLDPDSLPPT